MTFNILILNLFIGLVINNFRRIKDDLAGYMFLNPFQKEWVEMQKFMMRRDLDIIIPEPKGDLNELCYEIHHHPYFDRIIIFLIFLNIVNMGCIYQGIPESGQATINTLNNVFLAIFHIEAIIKILSIKWYYFKDSWNKFDFSIVVITDLVILSGFFISTDELKTLPIIARALRLGRVVKFIRASKSLRVLIDTIYFLLPSLVNISALIFLMVFIFAILGMNLFSGIQISQNDNFYPYIDRKNPANQLTF
jgi:hypothetical protein